MHASGSWDLVTLRRALPNSDFRVALMPKGPGGVAGSAMGGSSMWVPEGAEHRDLAFAFMTHLISDANALRLAKEEGRLPVRPRVFDDPFFADPSLQVFFEQLRTAHPPKLGAFDGPSEEFSAALEDVFRPGGGDARKALGDAQARALAILRP